MCLAVSHVNVTIFCRLLLLFVFFFFFFLFLLHGPSLLRLSKRWDKLVKFSGGYWDVDIHPQSSSLRTCITPAHVSKTCRTPTHTHTHHILPIIRMKGTFLPGNRVQATMISDVRIKKWTWSCVLLSYRDLAICNGRNILTYLRTQPSRMSNSSKVYTDSHWNWSLLYSPDCSLPVILPSTMISRPMHSYKHITLGQHNARPPNQFWLTSLYQQNTQMLQCKSC